ncbi:type II secretion system F family protein [Kitasatospora sp. NPDC054939]
MDDMAIRQAELVWVAALCCLALGGWSTVQRRAGVRRYRLLVAGERAGPDPWWPPPAAADPAVADARVRRGARGKGDRSGSGRRPAWLVAELLLLPAGLALGGAAGSLVPPVLAALAVLPLHRHRQQRRVAAQARQRAEAVVDLCTGLAAELRSGATPEQALHLVTARIGEDRTVLGSLGEEPVARLAAGRYGADVPAAFQLLAELPGGRGATAIAACWRISADSGAALARALDRVADALRAERALVEEIEGELAAPRTTIAVLAVLPVAGLLLGGALGAQPLDVLLHTPAGLLLLAVGAGLEAAGLLWTGRIVRAASRGALGPGESVAPVSVRPSALSEPSEPSVPAQGAGGRRCGISRIRARSGLPNGALQRRLRRAEVLSR